MSRGGRYAAVISTKHVGGNSASNPQVFRYDSQTGEMLLVSSAEALTNTFCVPIDIDAFGQRLIYFCGSNMYLKDLSTGQEALVAPNTFAQPPYITRDGSQVIFSSAAGDLVPGVNDGQKHVFSYNVLSGSFSVLDRSESGLLSNGDANYAIASNADGRYVLFDTSATNLGNPPAAQNGEYGGNHLYVKDTVTGAIKTLDVTPAGEAYGFAGSRGADITADGSLVAFGDSLWMVNPSAQYSNVAYVTQNSLFDTTAPVVTGVPDSQPNANDWYNHDVTIHWTATDDSGSAMQPVDTVASLEGTNTYTSGQSCDPSGNCATGSVTLSIDKTAPVINSHSWTSNPLTAGQSTTLSTSVTEANIGSVVYSVDGGAQVPMMQNFAVGTWDATFGSNLAVGDHAVVITATDLAGNSATATDTLTVVNIGTGNNVSVTPVSGVTVTFESVTSGGNTTATPATPPATTGLFKFGNPPTYYNISTTATFTGNVTVCMSYDPASVNGQGNNLALYHYHNGWSQITTSVDTTNHVICGVTTDFSGFGLVTKPDFQGLVDTMSAMNLKQGILNSLDSKFQDAQLAMNEAAAGDYSDVVGSLNAALNEIAAQRGKALTTDQADTLTAMTNEILSYFK